MKNKKMWLFILIGVFLGIVIAVFGIHTTNSTSKTGFCLSCHDNDAFVKEFKESPHANTECISCHTKGAIKDKTSGIKKVVKSYTGSVDPNNYKELITNVSEEKCLSCHNLDHEFRDKDRLNRHYSYLRKGFTCTRCHDKEFFHGKIE